MPKSPADMQSLPARGLALAIDRRASVQCLDLAKLLKQRSFQRQHGRQGNHICRQPSAPTTLQLLKQAQGYASGERVTLRPSHDFGVSSLFEPRRAIVLLIRRALGRRR